MSNKNQVITISGFIGFSIGVFSMMLVDTDKQVNCYELIKDIEYEVCEECWYDVFDCGEKYEEVKYYVNGE